MDEELTPLTASSLFSEDLMGFLVKNTNNVRIYIDGYANHDLMLQYPKEWRDITYKEMISTLTIFMYMDGYCNGRPSFAVSSDLKA